MVTILPTDDTAMTAEILQFAPTQARRPSCRTRQESEGLVSHLRALLARAESGELMGAYFVLNLRNEPVRSFAAGDIPPLPGTLPTRS